jgi:hypothetical protein
MAAVVDGNSMTNGADQAASEEDAANSDVELFSRVKNCIGRSLKKGLVISGLSAKIK